MHPTTTFLACLATLLPLISAHGTLTEIRGANGVNMNGLSVASNARNKNSISNTAIIRDNEIKSGRAGPLGRTSGGGAVNAASALQSFSRAAAGNATSTLPTAADDGTVTVIYHQVNADGAGPLDAAIDGTSGGTQANAFKTAQILQNVPGNRGVSSASNKDFTVKVQMPAGMTCDGTVGGVQNVCIVRIRNAASAGPFGGAAAFTQSAKSRKRAEEARKARRSEVAFTA